MSMSMFWGTRDEQLEQMKHRIVRLDLLASLLRLHKDSGESGPFYAATGSRLRKEIRTLQRELFPEPVKVPESC